MDAETRAALDWAASLASGANNVYMPRGAADRLQALLDSGSGKGGDGPARVSGLPDTGAASTAPPDAKPDPLEELRNIEADMKERAETGNSDMDDYRHWVGVRDGLAAWEKERAQQRQDRQDMHDYGQRNYALRAAVEKVRDELRNPLDWTHNGPAFTATSVFRALSAWADALDAALGGGA